MKALNSIFSIALATIFLSCSSPGERKLNSSEVQSNGTQMETPINQSKTFEVDLSFYSKKRKNGIEFYAVGNEPFWSLDMNFEKGFHFKTPDYEYNCPPVKADMAQDAPVERYRAVTESGELIISLQKEDCTDNMSGQAFSHKVSISIKRGTDSTYSDFSGCGRYVPDITLHDIWGLIEFNGEKIPGEKYPKGVQLELFPVEEKVIFNDGCNAYTGTFYTSMKEIHFGNMAGTLKACPQMDSNEKIGAHLAQHHFDYMREGQELHFFEDSSLVFSWRKID